MTVINCKEYIRTRLGDDSYTVLVIYYNKPNQQCFALDVELKYISGFDNQDKSNAILQKVLPFCESFKNEEKRKIKSAIDEYCIEKGWRIK